MAEPQADDGYVDACMKQLHGGTVTQGVGGDGLGLQRGAGPGGGGCCAWVEQERDGVT